MKIFIDPGHGGSDRANKGPTGYVEADGNLDMALRLQKLLAPYHEVRLARTTDQTVSLDQRSKMANDWGADLMISIHSNAGPAAAAGIETFRTARNQWGTEAAAKAKEFAEAIQAEMIRKTGRKDRGVKTRSGSTGLDFYSILRKTKAPALIIEAGFHSNPEEERLLLTPVYRQQIAEAIAAGVAKVAGGGETVSKTNQVDIYIKGKPIQVASVLQDGMSLVHIRPILEALGHTVDWIDGAVRVDEGKP